MWINKTNKSRKQDPFSFTCHLRSATSQSEVVRKVEDNPAGCRALTMVSFWGKPQWCSPNRLPEIQPINITVWSCMEKAMLQKPRVSNISPPLCYPDYWSWYSSEKHVSFSLKIITLAQGKLKEITLKSTCETQTPWHQQQNQQRPSQKLASWATWIGQLWNSKIPLC